MVSWIGLIAIVWSLTDMHRCTAFDIDCNTNRDCKYSMIECLPDEDCFISCEKPKSCLGSTIICPQTGDCNIECRGGQSCMDSIINATLQSPMYDFNLLCQESTDHCKNIAVYGSKVDLDTNTNINHKFNISCNGLLRSCVNSEFHCPANGDCFVSCNADSSCRGTDIFGPDSDQHSLYIECNNIKSCFDGKFDGSASSKMEITGCMEAESCFDLSIYCPPFSNNKNMKNKNCFISGNENIGRDNAGGTKIFAMNGWRDIDIDYNGTYGLHHGGKMYCGTDYEYSCNIAPDNWTCDVNGGYTYCNNPILNSPPSTTLYTTFDIEDVTTNTDINDTNMDNTKDEGYIDHIDNNGAHDDEDDDDAESKESYAIFSDDWPFESRILFGIGVILIIAIVGFYCYCTNRQNKDFSHHIRHGQKSKPTVDRLKGGNHHHLRSWPKGIEDDFYGTSSTKEEVQDDEEDDFYDNVIGDDETDMMSTPQVKTASIHPRSEPRSPPQHHGVIDEHEEDEFSKTATFPETMVRIPHHLGITSSLPGATKLHENMFVTMIEDSLQRNKKNLKDPRSPNAKLGPKLSVPDGLIRYPSNSDDVLHLNRQKRGHHHIHQRFFISTPLSKSSNGSYVEMTPHLSETDEEHDDEDHHTISEMDVINYRKPTAQMVDDATIDGKIDMEELDRTDIVTNPTNIRQQTTEQEKVRLFSPTETDHSFHAEMVNPVNTLPTTRPSAIFSPHPSATYL